MSEQETFYCSNCGKEISELEYQTNGGLCDDCYNQNEDELDEEMFR